MLSEVLGHSAVAVSPGSRLVCDSGPQFAVGSSRKQLDSDAWPSFVTVTV